jgi:hypothetical protein
VAPGADLRSCTTIPSTTRARGSHRRQSASTGAAPRARSAGSMSSARGCGGRRRRRESGGGDSVRSCMLSLRRRVAPKGDATNRIVE